MPQFIHGLRLSRLFYEQAVKPILERVLPELAYSAALIGSGSEVLGFDDEMSTDHHWGPRVMLFLHEVDAAKFRDIIDTSMRNELPPKFLGYPTNFSEPDSNDNNTQLLVPVIEGPVNHRVVVDTFRNYLLSYLNFDVDAEISPADWLTFPEHKLLTLTAGEVFHDGAEIGRVRERFNYYPQDVWLYLLASAWNRIGQEEHLMGRAGLVGDEIGSTLIGARLVRDLIRLCFLMERKYAPYPKWFGTAFQRLDCSKLLSPHLEAALRANSWQERERSLARVYEMVAQMHNALEITLPLAYKPGNFFGRPFKVIEQIGGFSAAIVARISDPEVKRIASGRLLGGIDQYSDSTDLLSDAHFRPVLRSLYS